MPSIYDIKKEIAECLDEETGEIFDIEKLESLMIAKDEKIDNVGCWYKGIVADITAIENEIRSLKERKGSKERILERLEEYLFTATDGKKFESPRVKISWRPSESVRILDESALTGIPEEYIKTKTERSADKTAIKTAIKSGAKVSGAELTGKMNLQIK